MPILKTLGLALAGALAGAIAAIVVVSVVHPNARPRFEAWHVIHLAGDLTAVAPPQTFEDYDTKPAVPDIPLERGGIMRRAL